MQAKIFKALANTNRMLIVRCLINKELSVFELQQIVGTNKSTISRHVAILKDAEIVHSRKKNLKIICSIEKIICDMHTLASNADKKMKQ